jgi:hypothetical protein
MVPVDFRLVADPSQTGAPQPEAPPPRPGQRFFTPKEERQSSEERPAVRPPADRPGVRPPADRPAVRPPADRRREIRMREDRAPVATGRLEAVVDLQVLPESAVVYLDGAFIGTASELARMELGVGLAAGAHRVDVMAPGFESRSIDLTVTAGERKELDVELEPAE